MKLKSCFSQHHSLVDSIRDFLFESDIKRHPGRILSCLMQNRNFSDNSPCFFVIFLSIFGLTND